MDTFDYTILMGFKYEIDLPLDSPERTIHHREIILNKPFLKKLYYQWYNELTKELPNLPDKPIIELGSGGGFLKEVHPEVICTDILELPSNDMTLSALDMPFENASIGGIFMIDTLHHIPDMEGFFTEADRTLASGGKIIMIEPVNSMFGRFIYKNFHHEPFDVDGGWTIPSTGPLSGANGALPWIVLERDAALFKKKYPNFSIEKISYRNPLLYLISGGVSFKQLLPDFMYPIVNMFDSILPKVFKQFSMFQLIVVTKK